MTDGPDELDEYFTDSKEKADAAFRSGVDRLGSVMTQDETEKPRVAVKMDVGFLYATNDINDDEPQVAMILSVISSAIGGGKDAPETTQPYIVHEYQILSLAVNALLTFCDDETVMIFMRKLVELMQERREQSKNNKPVHADSSAFAMEMLRLIEDLKEL